MATAILSDTHKWITKLMQKGFSEDQAKILVAAVQELDLSHLATKDDLQQLKVDLMKWNATVVAIGVAILALIKFV